MAVAKPKCRWLASLGVTKPRLARTVPAGPRARSRWSVAVPRWCIAAPLAATIAVALSCGGDTTAPTPPPPPPPPPPQPTTVSVTPAQVRLTVGESAQLAAEVRDQNGQVMTGVAVTWASSDAAVATVTSGGLVRGVSAGSATISAAAGQASGGAAATVSPDAPHPDRDALVALYNATGGPDWDLNAKWLTDEPLNQWYGVVTNPGGSVRGLSLSRNGLAGALPPELGDLADLRGLYLSDNSLSGTIPPELGNLANLEELWLYSNQLAGSVPATLLRLDKLATFTLNDNAGLCAPGTTAFAEWLAGISNAAVDYCNQQDKPVLEALYQSAGGTEWNDSDGWLADGPVLGDWHGIAADSLGRVVGIDLADNGLAGRLPAELARLTELRELRVGDNPQLTGILPPTLTELELTDLHYAGTGLCSADTPAFRDWLATITSHEGTGEECSSDRYVLATLYESAGGDGWTNSANWLSDEALGEWHGVTTNSSGSVVGLDLSDNGLAGTFPPELGYLSNLERLFLSGNQLSGPIPLELGDLSNLELLGLFDNRLSGTIPSELGNLANLEYMSLGRNQLSGTIPAELGNLGNIERLYLYRNQLSGSIPAELGNLANLERLHLYRNELVGPIPSVLGSLANLEDLRLFRNLLSGPIPSELGNLANLTHLDLYNNQLTGAIPSELGNLANLAYLDLSPNELSGPIPAELGNLGNLETLWLSSNELSGPIPAELGNLGNLERLYISDNQLTGAIPPELGNLRSLKYLYLGDNQLSGALPVGFGSLANLERLYLNGNQLSGGVPAVLGNLAKLERFAVTNNSEMEGSLHASMTSLGMLAEFLAGGTALCAPAEHAFLTWLEGIRKRRIRLCEDGDDGESAVYLTQAVQSLAFPVPLVADEEALLRVFVSASDASGEGMPPVRARFYRDGSEVHVANIAAPSAAIPTSLNQGSLRVSANASIPATVVQPGLEMVVEIDPDSTLDASLGVTRRIPAEGRATVSVLAAPDLDLTLIPFLWREAPDSAVVRETTDLTAGDTLLAHINTLLPVQDIDLKVLDPVFTGSNDAYALLAATGVIRTLAGAAGDSYYMGLMSSPTTSAAGVAYVPGRTGFSVLSPRIMAHELGHNLSLNHAPCGGAGGPDTNFPESDGTIGAWGFDMRGDSLLAPGTFDLMSYCGPQWISDYHFTNAFGYRLHAEAVGAGAPVDGPERSLLLWGGVGEGGEPFLEPAIIVDAPPSLPPSPGGEYAVAGHDADGRELFSLSFDMPVLSHGEGRSAFAFTLPARQEWAGALAEITLSGPGGSFTLDESSDRAAAILRDPLTGQVRGIFHDAPPSVMAAAGVAAPLGREAAAALSLEPGLEVFASRGIPRPEDWRR